MADPEALYVLLSQLLASVPVELTTQVTDPLKPSPLSDEAERWLARAYALVSESGVDRDDTAEMKMLTTKFAERFQRHLSTQSILNILRRTAAVMELRSPVGAQGSFIHAGNVFDAMAALSNVLRRAATDLLIVDPYLDEIVLTDFVQMAPEKIPVRLLADQFSLKPTLRAAYQRWAQQFGATRPLSARLASPPHVARSRHFHRQPRSLSFEPVVQCNCGSFPRDNHARGSRIEQDESSSVSANLGCGGSALKRPTAASVRSCRDSQA